MTPERDPQYLTLAAAARHALCQLSPAHATAAGAAFLEAAATALSVFVPLYAGDPPRRLSERELAGRRLRGPALACLLVERTAFEAGLAKLARAGVRFSEVRHETSPRRLPTVSPRLSPA